jgi:hypothetical protein
LNCFSLRLFINELGRRVRSSAGTNKTIEFQVIGTDSWDTTTLVDTDAARILQDNSYVILPDSSGGKKLFGGWDLTTYFNEMTPKSQAPK